MKKIKTYKGFIIAIGKDDRYHLFTKDEWECGEGFRSEEWDTGSITEATQWIDVY